MKEPDPMQELEIAHDSLLIVARKTKNGFDGRMRATVKEMLGYRYPLKAVPAEKVRSGEEFTQILESSEIFSNLIFGTDSSKQRQFMKKVEEWNRTRPERINRYIKRLADIFPAEHLTQLLSSSQLMTAEELIALYEAKKGEAKSSDYSGYPTGIDSSKLKSIATIVRVL